MNAVRTKTAGSSTAWEGKPEKWPFVLRVWPLSILLGLGPACSGAFALLSSVLLTPGHQRGQVLVVGLLGLLFGMVLFLGPFLLSYLEYRNVSYRVDASSISMIIGMFKRRTFTIPLSEVRPSLFIHGNGTGSIFLSGPSGLGPTLRVLRDFCVLTTGAWKPSSILFVTEYAMVFGLIRNGMAKPISLA